MGKPTGFMEFKRMNKEELPGDVRIRKFNDYRIKFDLKTQREEASRWM